jgi:hypothetical protein
MMLVMRVQAVARGRERRGWGLKPRSSSLAGECGQVIQVTDIVIPSADCVRYVVAMRSCYMPSR